MLDAELGGELGKIRLPGRESAELQLWIRGDDLERLAPDRARGAEESDPFNARSLRVTYGNDGLPLRPKITALGPLAPKSRSDTKGRIGTNRSQTRYSIFATVLRPVGGFV